MTTAEIFKRLQAGIMDLEKSHNHGLMDIFHSGNHTSLTGVYDLANLLLDLKSQY